MSSGNPEGPVVDDRYEVLGAVGASGLSEAVARPAGTAVAIALSDVPFPPQVADLVRLRHPNLASVLEVGRSGDRHFLVVAPVPDRALSDALASPIAAEDAARIGSGLARALQQLHRAGLVHGAVEPDLVRLGERPVLMAPTRPAVAPYRAPEGPIDARSDVYALGVLLYRMVAGVVPPALDPIPPMQVAVPATLEHITRRALQPRPVDRYADVGQIALALDAWLATRAGPTPPPAPVVRSVPRVVGTVASVATGLVLLALGMAVLTVGWRSAWTPAEVEVIGPPADRPPDDVVVDDVSFDPAHAERALAWLNTAPEHTLVAAGIYDQGVSAILAGRPFGSLAAAANRPGVGRKTLEAVSAATR